MAVYGGKVHIHHQEEKCYDEGIYLYHLGCHQWVDHRLLHTNSSKGQYTVILSIYIYLYHLGCHQWVDHRLLHTNSSKGQYRYTLYIYIFNAHNKRVVHPWFLYLNSWCSFPHLTALLFLHWVHVNEHCLNKLQLMFLVCWGFYFTLTIFQSYPILGAGACESKALKSKWAMTRVRSSNQLMF